MSDVHSNTHVGEMEPVTEEDQRKSDDMVTNKLLEVFARLLQLEQQHNCLLKPVSCLQKIVCLELRCMLPMRKSFEHCGCVEIPDVGSTHDPETERAKDRKIHGSIYLLHETCNLSLSANVTVKRPWSNYSLHQEFTGEGENHGVKSDECKIFLSFAIHHRFARIFRFAGVRQEESGVQWISFGRIYRVCRE